MATAFDGSAVPDWIETECGSDAYFDHGSGCSYICETCLCTVGSISMPGECKEIHEMASVIRKLKGK